MGKETEISWSHATFNPWLLPCSLPSTFQFAGTVGLIVQPIVATTAESQTIGNVKAKFGVVCKWLDMMGHKIAAPIITALLAGEGITAEYVEAPSLIFHREALSTALSELAIFVLRQSITTRCTLPSPLTYQRACLGGVLNASAITTSFLCRVAHLAAGFFGHRRTFLHDPSNTFNVGIIA